MPSLTCFNFRFTPNWLMTFLAVVFISLFVRLGYWQIQRADEKEKMVAAEQSLAKQEPIRWGYGDKLPRQYQRLSIEGTYLTELFLFDNQHHDHQFGYDVLSPVLLGDGTVVLVDRGWIPGDITRQSFPQIKTPTTPIRIQGTAYFPSADQWVLGPNFEKKNNKLVIIESLNKKLFEQLLQKKVYPFIIRLETQDAHGFVREWAIVSMPPQRHLAYALQWFAMALVVLILYVALNLKKIK